MHLDVKQVNVKEFNIEYNKYRKLAIELKGITQLNLNKYRKNIL